MQIYGKLLCIHRFCGVLFFMLYHFYVIPVLEKRNAYTLLYILYWGTVNV